MKRTEEIIWSVNWVFMSEAYYTQQQLETPNISQQAKMDSPAAVKKLLTAHSDVLKDYQLLHFGTANFNSQEFINRFRDLARSEAKKSLLNSSVQENWDLESKLWDLLSILLTFRSSVNADATLKEDTTIYSYNSDIVYKKSFLQNNKETYELWLIMCWIQGNLKSPVRPNGLSGSKWINSSVSGNMASCDVDYPLRENYTLDEKDLNTDSETFKYIYELLLCGKIDEAQEECELTENLALGMIMCGFSDYYDPRIDTQVASKEDETIHSTGSEKKVLWRRAVFSLSENPALDKYERAIYKYLAGSIPETDKEHITIYNWDTYLLLYLNQLWTVSIENYFKSIHKFPQSENILALPESLSDVQSIMNTVATKAGAESQHPIRVLMAAIILKNVSSVIKSSVQAFSESLNDIQSKGLFEKEPFLLRLLTHLVIVCDIVEPGSVDKEDKFKLISSYVTILNMYGLQQAIPVYVLFLEEDSLISLYSSILSTISDATSKKEQLFLCSALQLPTSNILKKLAQSVFSSTSKHYATEIGQETSIETGVTSHDAKLVNAIQWLVEGHLYSESMSMIIAVCRRFLICGRADALTELLTSIDISGLINDYKISNMDSEETLEDSISQNVEEVLQYNNLVTGLTLYKNWVDASKLLNNQSNLPSLVEKFREFSSQFQELIGSFLSDLVHEDETLYQIRALYVPYLVIELHKSLMDAFEALQITAFAYEALNLSSVVADEGSKIYLLFQSSGKLKEFLRLVAESSIKVGVRNN